MAVAEKPHAVCIPYPAQGHINPMLKLAKLLLCKGFHIIFVNTEFNFLSTACLTSSSIPSPTVFLRPTSTPPKTSLHLICDSTSKNCLAPFRNLLTHLNDTSSSNVLPVSCIVADGIITFSLKVVEELGIPEVLFWTTSACGFLGYVHYSHLIGPTPLKDESYLTNGYLDTVIDWAHEMKDIRLRDFPSFIRTSDPNDIMLNYFKDEVERASKASAIIINTFEAFEHDASCIGCAFIGEQQTNCRYTCKEWGIGMEIDNNVKREEVETLVRELMEGEKGKEMKKAAMEWKKIAEEATRPYLKRAMAVAEKPHAVCIPYPAQGHINPMLKLAKLLHYKGFHITFVNTEFNHQRLLKSRGPDSLKGLHNFQFHTIPDGLPPSDVDATQDIPSLCESTSKNCLAPFRNLLTHLNDTSSSNVPPVSCIVSDGITTFTLKVAEELGIPEVLFWTTSACGFLGYVHYCHLIERGLTPLKDESYLTNGYLDTVIDWVQGMKDIRLRDFPSFIRTSDPSDIMLNFFKEEVERAFKASAIVINTFEAFERDALDALSSIVPPIYTIGPLQLLQDQILDNGLKNIGSNLWKEEIGCLEWLNSKEPNSVVYVNFGSITVMTPQHLTEFAWGLANSKETFLWIIRPDLVVGDAAILPSEFVTETKERGMLASWCSQEQVLKHRSIGGFLTHCGWNSTFESVCGGVPMICWPFFAEQQTNCRYACKEWGIGMEIDNNVRREEVERLVRELMEGEKGKEMKNKAMEWKKIAEEATRPVGSSHLNVDKVINEVLLSKKNCLIRRTFLS
ncbi:hypothetical protein HHK36_031802 [Tetracentron sinense]|uniref:Glycosyltransferase N-terminal domain-containing protein n=1 Tax=Tetracentron sinense TaxID=13715 RepID=A0A835CY77_TETSI|nr:hypothetical protein HHK36_031802 [Tetracentron sinense]